MGQWRTYVTLSGTRRVMIGLIISISVGMIPLTLPLVKNELIERAGEPVALEATDIADKLDIVLTERVSDIQDFAQSPLGCAGFDRAAWRKSELSGASLRADPGDTPVRYGGRPVRVWPGSWTETPRSRLRRELP